jgi:glutathione S-transferase
MKLYFSKGACSLAVRISIHELGAVAEYEGVHLKTKRTHSDEDYLKINPKGAVPVLKLENGEYLTENAAIQTYLADTFRSINLLPPLGDLKRYRVLEWLSFISSDLHKTCSSLWASGLSDSIKSEYFIPLLRSKLDFANQQLGNNPYLIGEQFTIADSYFFVILFWLPLMKIELADWPNLDRYYNEVKSRPAVHQALTEEGILQE